MQLDRRSSPNFMLCATAGTIYDRTCRPGPSKQQICFARTMYHFLLRGLASGGLNLAALFDSGSNGPPGLLGWSRIGVRVVRARGRVPVRVPERVPALAAVSVPAVGLVVAQTPGRSPPQTSGNLHLALSLGCQKANAWLPPVRVMMYGKLREGSRRSRSVEDFAQGTRD